MILSTILKLLLCAVSIVCQNVISVQNEAQLINAYSSELKKFGSAFIFFNEDSGTYLTQNYELETDAIYLPNGEDCELTDELGDFCGSRKLPMWFEVYYDSFELSNKSLLIPVSLCHSEVYGEGGQVSLQAVFATSRTGSGKIGGGLAWESLAISSAAGVALQKSDAVATTMRCPAKAGEIIQLFLNKTKFLKFTSRYRRRQFSSSSRELNKFGRFLSQDPRREVIEGGLGEWVCASNAMTELDCFGVGKSSLFA